MLGTRSRTCNFLRRTGKQFNFCVLGAELILTCRYRYSIRVMYDRANCVTVTIRLFRYGICDREICYSFVGSNRDGRVTLNVILSDTKKFFRYENIMRLCNKSCARNARIMIQSIFIIVSIMFVLLLLCDFGT